MLLVPPKKNKIKNKFRFHFVLTISQKRRINSLVCGYRKVSKNKMHFNYEDLGPITETVKAGEFVDWTD